MMSGTRVTICILMALSAMTMGACKQQDFHENTTLIVGRAVEAANIDPGITTTNPVSQSILRLCYETLMREVIVDGAATGDVEGSLVEYWSSDDSGKIWTFKLKDGHHFDDGSLVTSAAVKFSFERTFRVTASAKHDRFWLDRIEVVNDTMFKIHLTRPFTAFLHYLTGFAGTVVNPAVMEHENEADNATLWLSEHTAGSGPYRLAHWDHGQRMVLEPNPYAATPIKYFTGVIFKLIKDPSVRRTQLRNGEIDILEGITAEDINVISAMKGVHTISRVSPATMRLEMNNLRAPFNDPAVRRAIAYSIDYQGMVEDILNGHGRRRNGPIPLGVPGHDPSLPLLERDLEKARTLLADAGFSTALEPLEIEVSYTAADPTAKLTALALQANMLETGISLKLAPQSVSALIDKVFSYNFDLLLGAMILPAPDPWWVMYNGYVTGKGGNYIGYSSTQVDEVLEQAMGTFEPDKRLDLYQQAQTLIIEDMPRVWLYNINGFLAYSDDLTGLDYSVWTPMQYNVADMSRKVRN